MRDIIFQVVNKKIFELSQSKYQTVMINLFVYLSYLSSQQFVVQFLSFNHGQVIIFFAMKNSPYSGIFYGSHQPSFSMSEIAQSQQELSSASRTSFTSFTNNSCTLNSKYDFNSTTTTIKRKDQLKPTTKLSINQRVHDSGRKMMPPQYLQNKQRKLREEKRQIEQKMITTLNYNNSIKPSFGLIKYIGLCGVQKGSGIYGCQCFNQPCEWQLKWTKNYNPKCSKLYANLSMERYDLKMAQQIQKDLPRTYPECPTFSSNYQFRKKLRNILRVYTVYDIEVGYVQGMNMIAAVLLYHIKKQDQTFWAFADLMDQQQLRLIYQTGFESLKKHTNNIISLINRKLYALHQHMIQLDVTPEAFLYGWLLSLMSNCIPLEYMHLVIDKFRVQGWIFMYKLIITYLLFLKQGLMHCEESSQFLTTLSNTSSKQLGLHWREILDNCYKLEL